MRALGQTTDEAASEQHVLREEKRPPVEEATEVAPGVIRLQLTIAFPGLGHVNCYAMEDRRGITLVDPGLPGRQPYQELTRRLARAGLPVERVHTVIVTHSHPDHFGAAGHLREVTGAEIVTHAAFKTFFDPNEEDDDPKDLADAGDLDTWAAGRERLARSRRTLRDVAQRTGETSVGRHAHDVVGIGRDQIRQWRRWNGPTPWGGEHPKPPWRTRLNYATQLLTGRSFYRPPQPSARVIDGQVLPIGEREWVAVHTPGHTVDHLCLFDPVEGILISGDHVLPTITPHISGLVNAPDPLRLYFDSLERMHTLDDIRVVLPAHGLTFDNLSKRATDIQEHHQERLSLLRAAGEDLGEASVRDYTQRQFKPTSWGPMADSETYAHLEHLVFKGEAVRREVPGDGLHYRLVG